MQMINLCVVTIISYLLGSLNTSIIVGKFYGIDVRKHGSGNAGMTNTLRTLGKLPAILVTVGDILKAVIGCLIGFYFVGNINGYEGIGFMAAGTAAVLGHNWPIFFGFKGGKGVLTSLAVMLFMNWKIALIVFGIFLIIVLITKYISLGSIIGAALFPIIGFYSGESNIFIIFALILSSLSIVRHRANIERLIKGNENKFSLKKKSNT